MRFLLGALIMSCCAVSGYSQESTEEPVVTTEEGGSGEVANVDSKKQEKPASSGCGCNKPKF